MKDKALEAEQRQSDWHSVNDSDLYLTHSDGVEHRAHEKISGGDLNMHTWYK